MNNWPALSSLLYDGWVLRFADGYTKRANSISPLYRSTLDLHRKIEECEQLYSSQHLCPTYKMTPFIQPDNLDRSLEEKGYACIDMTSVQTLTLTNLKKPDPHSITIEENVTVRWVEQFGRANHVEHKNKEIMRRMLSNIRTKKGFITLYDQEQPVAFGLGVIEREHIGLYDIVTDAAYRNQGFGEQVILHLLQWGKENGAKHSYLAVVANNAPALRLYSKVGYSEIYKYWYRVKE
ncbi:GNAT family N-acetyltransferase [Paenibacillus sp. CECT 9249]|uniref:GNAT family N-acetyltransferase n=1 Tax=Paenibacillus sp. CECT 9249 TaxID=2845385 RepID=UPI001E44E4C6|nr:GNAT family N-acetyltransferase [Paenibacillus sp. CECT 9249]